MQSLSLSHPHIVRTFQFHSCIRKERIPWQTPRRHALKSQSLRWHYPNQVRSKIYLPLSLSHKLPLLSIVFYFILRPELLLPDLLILLSPLLLFPLHRFHPVLQPLLLLPVLCLTEHHGTSSYLYLQEYVYR